MTDHERYLFDLNGYITVRNALTPEQLTSLNALLDEQIVRSMPVEESTHRFGSPLNWGQPYMDVLDNPTIYPFVEAINGRHARLDHSYLDVIRDGSSPIGATLHGGGTPFQPGEMYHVHNGQIFCGLTVVAYNLHDVHAGDGGFGCVPGSHKANYRFPDAWRNLEQPESIVQHVVGPAGTAIIFTEALTHGALPWRGRQERRTLFYKYTDTAMGWSARFTFEDRTDLTERQRRLLMPPGSVFSKDRYLSRS
ncbi:MAG: phytanoyl-CoA dioxygenase family protein [Verrucomicrobia bacterium]|nr:phytanoyl-CoA dioxygenase family protein [Verrucomicrobiota bacterium]